jgi:hypothetical protein
MIPGMINGTKPVVAVVESMAALVPLALALLQALSTQAPAGITPGDYTLFAWETVERGAYMDPDFLRPYKDRGKPIRVDEGSKLNSQLELIRQRVRRGKKLTASATETRRRARLENERQG